jgi:hypothetical protein
VKSHTTERFRIAFANLPEDIQRQAREAYRLFQANPSHPGLRFRQVHPTRPMYSARINRDYRAVGVRNNDTIIWFWIGSHDDYDRLLGRV